jgi:uncharacterized ion transporter superfamily protein YfcC
VLADTAVNPPALADAAERGFRTPPAVVIVTAILLLAGVASVILPRGSFERRTMEFEQLGLTRSVVIPGTFPVEGSGERGPLMQEIFTAASNVVLAPIAGFQERAEVIAFVLIIGGAFGIMLASGALDRILLRVVQAVGESEARILVIPVSMILFSLGGAIFGMGECAIGFVLITVPLAIRLGYDTITGVCMTYLATQVGFGGAFFNPFTIGIAQAIAELPYLSGSGLRYILWAGFTGAAILFVMWHARRVQKDPRRSPTFAMDETIRERLKNQEQTRVDVSMRDGLVLFFVFASVIVTSIGVKYWNWWIPEMSGAFLVCGLGAAVAAGMSARLTVDRFMDGAKMMIEPCLIIAISAGIVYVLSEARVLDTMLHAVSQPLQWFGPGVAAVLLMCMQAVINFFVPSGSGQAAMTMPITAPLCDIVGLERQVGVLAFQFGDGFGNMLIPTSAVLMGALAVARVDWVVWVKWVWPLILLLHVLGAVALLVAVNLPGTWLN